MKLHLIRHGQTDWNLMKKIQGQTDIELNDTGKNQAREAKVITDNYDYDLIICSPLKRTRKTAEIINENRNIEIIYRDALMERFLGLLEGKDTELEKDILYNYNLNISDENIEPVQNLCKRVFDLLDEIKEKYADKRVLLVTHGGTTRAVEAYFNGISDDGDLPPDTLKNCEIREYNFPD